LYQTLLADSSLYVFLFQLDEDIAADCRRGGCPCSGSLHSAKYPRKPRGLPPGLEDKYDSRFSFCCAREGCRCRSTPASFRFLGRKVFVAAVVVLVSALRHGATPKRVAMLRELVGVSRRTVERWREWWQNGFVRSPFWKAVRGRLKTPVDSEALPLSLLNMFSGKEAKIRLISLLRLLLPLTKPMQDI
jgi:hypothetical protein